VWFLSQEEKRIAAMLSKFTKPCPDCKQLIEKCGGCNHMKCLNPR
jgi:hypothetical protein